MLQIVTFPAFYSWSFNVSLLNSPIQTIEFIINYQLSIKTTPLFCPSYTDVLLKQHRYFSLPKSSLDTTGLGGFGGYGGVDTGGTIVPGVKQNNGLLDNLWW